MLIILDTPPNRSQAFDELERTFGAQSFSAEEAIVAISEGLEIDQNKAAKDLNQLVSRGYVGEA